MQILIVDGWTEDGNQDHFLAGCVRQTQVFETLVRELSPGVSTTTVNTHNPNATADLDLSTFQAVIWTGGGGNIYENNDFNRDQLALCERVLADVPFFWGSCWGLQVAVTVLGGKISKAKTPEIGIALDISTSSSVNAEAFYRGKPAKFDGPAHHGDEVARLPDAFEIIAQNDVTVQAVVTDDGKILCTQYHPEIPYDYLRKLLVFWAPNYRELFSDVEFDALLSRLTEKEAAEEKMRKIEFKNWLDFIA